MNKTEKLICFVLAALLAGYIFTESGKRREAAASAAYINGKAGELAQSRAGSVSMTAGDTAGCVGEIVRRLETKENCDSAIAVNKVLSEL